MVITRDRHQIAGSDALKAFDIINASNLITGATNPNVNGTAIIKDQDLIIVFTGNLKGADLSKTNAIGWKIEDENIIKRFKKHLNDMLPSFMQK